MDLISYPCGIPDLTGMTLSVYNHAVDGPILATKPLVENTGRPGYYTATFDIVVLALPPEIYAFLPLKDGLSIDDYMFAFLSGSNTAELVRDKLLLTAADPLGNEVPDGYSPGTAGYVIGHLVEDISSIISRSTTGTYSPMVGDLIKLTFGDDYFESDNREISKSIDDPTLPDWTDLDSVVFRFTINAISVDLTGTIVDKTGNPRIVKTDASRSQLAPLGKGCGLYEIIILRSDGTVVHYTTIVDNSPLTITP